MSITWANQSNGVTVWACTVDLELMAPLVVTEVEQALAKRKVLPSPVVLALCIAAAVAAAWLGLAKPF